MSEMPPGVHGPAADKYSQFSYAARRGGEILSEIRSIDEQLFTLESLKDLHIGTFNNCTFRPKITPDAIRSFVVSHLTERRRALVTDFNRRFAE